jgi:hypothetical protein
MVYTYKIIKIMKIMKKITLSFLYFVIIFSSVNIVEAQTQTISDFSDPSGYTISNSSDLRIKNNDIVELVPDIDILFNSNDISGDADSSGVATGDLNGNGYLDIYTTNDGQNKLWINDGSGNFTANDIPGDTDRSSGAIMGDFNGDGHLDIYVTNRSLGSQNKLWINDGSGNFTANDIPGDTGRSSGAAMGDINGDGHLDIYVANVFGQNKLWINDGSGNFTANDIPGDGEDGYGAAMGDVNGDGHLDIYLAADSNELFINDGAGNFTSVSGSIPTSLTGGSRGVVMDDINGDGHLDIYLSNRGWNLQNTLWINDGSGNFTSDNISGDGERSNDAFIGDINGDGYNDIYVVNSWGAQNRLWINDVTITYPTTSPYVEPNTSVVFPTTLISFAEGLGTENEGSVSYQVSVDNGVTWEFWNGSEWAITTQIDGSETSNAIDINSNIETLKTDGGDFLWRAYLNSDGTQAVELDYVQLDFLNEYIVRFFDFDDTQIGTDQAVDHGSDAIAPTDPIRSGHSFTGWSPSALTNIIEDTNFTAQWKEDNDTPKTSARRRIINLERIGKSEKADRIKEKFNVGTSNTEPESQQSDSQQPKSNQLALPELIELIEILISLGIIQR